MLLTRAFPRFDEGLHQKLSYLCSSLEEETLCEARSSRYLDQVLRGRQACPRLRINIGRRKIIAHLCWPLEGRAFALDYLFSVAVRITAKDNVTTGCPSGAN